MRIPAVLLFSAFATGVACAQPASGAQRTDRQLDHQQLRGDLRGASRPQRVGESDAGMPASTEQLPVVLPRHLTPRERAELRQQLRQEQSAARKNNP